MHPVVKAQPGLAVNDITPDFSINKIINSPVDSARFTILRDKLVVIDFFGTWCVPCVKAIPHLSALQEKYKNEINIILVSDEAESKLESFIKKQDNFKLPVVVDEPGIFTKLFQPPAYPYTVIVAKNGRVLAIPSQEEMTEANINKWLSLQHSTNELPVIINKTIIPVISSANEIKIGVVEKSTNKWVQLSQDFVYAAKTGDATEVYSNQLKEMGMEELTQSLQTDDEKKAFWINLYNAYTQESLRKDPGQYKERGQFFKNKQISIAGKQFSLDDIEHGILRRSKIKWSLGYLNKLFPNKTEKNLRVQQLDYRLHFALNCGAKSCPPIAYYRSESIGQQLSIATKTYLKGEVEYDENKNTVKLPALMSWFRRDFGGKKKMITLLKTLSIVPENKSPRIVFKDYDWTLYL